MMAVERSTKKDDRLIILQSGGLKRLEKPMFYVGFLIFGIVFRAFAYHLCT